MLIKIYIQQSTLKNESKISHSGMKFFTRQTLDIRSYWSSLTYKMAQIIWSTKCLVKALLDIQQKFYLTSSRAIFATGRPVDIYSFQQTSSRQLFICYQTSNRKFLLDVQQKFLYQTSNRAEDLGQYLVFFYIQISGDAIINQIRNEIHYL